jgi:hypothetical protein
MDRVGGGKKPAERGPFPSTDATVALAKDLSAKRRSLPLPLSLPTPVAELKHSNMLLVSSSFYIGKRQ